MSDYRSTHIARTICMAAVSAAALASGAVTPALSQVDDVIRIGIVSPNTGAAARYGAFAWRGAQLAGEEINVAGGVLGKKIRLFQADSQCVPTEGVSATQRLITQDKVSMIIGDVCSSVTLAMQPIVENSSVLLMNAASSNPEITYRAGVGGHKWTFRNYPTDESRALMVLKYAAEQKKFSKLAVLSIDSDYGRGAISLTKKYLDRFGAQIVSEDYYKDKEADFRPVLATIRRSGAQAIVMYGLADTVPVLARQMIESGLAGKVVLMGSAEFNNPEAIKAAGSALEGAIEAAAWVPEWDAPKNKEFVETYRKKYDGETPNVHAYTYWETLRLLAQAMREAKSISSEDVRKTLASMTYEGVMGKVTFDDHNQARLPMILFEISGGKSVIKGAFSSDIQYPKR